MFVEPRCGQQNRERAGQCNTTPRLEGLNDRVVGRVEMLGGMLILRIVAAADMTTDETETQMHPGITYFQAILAAIGARCDLSYLVKMTTLFCHRFLFPFSFSSARAPFKHFYSCFCSTNSPSMKILTLHEIWRVGKRTEGSFSQFKLPLWK